MALFEKIKQTLEHAEVCILSQRGKHLYAVLPWERYQDLVHNEETASPNEITPESSDISAGVDIDINDIPV